MKFNFLFAALLAFLQQQVFAETKLVVQKTDGTTEEFLLSDKPEMTIYNKSCIFVTKKTAINIRRTDIVDFHFEEYSSDIDKVEANGICVKFINDNNVCFTGLKGRKISIYDVEGKAFQGSIETIGDDTIVSLSNLPKGIYVIKYINSSIKLAKK